MSPDRQDEKKLNDEDEMNSSDEALLELLGLESLDTIVADTKWEDSCDDSSSDLPQVSDSILFSIVESRNLLTRYKEDSVCYFPPELSIPASHMRRLTDELVWSGESVQADRTYETIKVWKQGEILERRTLTRLENFVDFHDGWRELCHNYLRRCISAALGMEMVLYKEKLNLKPPGGSGFAAHLDSPSLRIALGPNGPQTFCTVMVAIDDMTSKNGCLRICKGDWSEEYCCKVIEPDQDGNPDAGGRAGAIPHEIAESLNYEDLTCKGGTIVAFNGWAPHRSAANMSPFPRRAVFLTFNPKSEGDFHERYYQKMQELRTAWRESVGLEKRKQREEDERMELEALKSIPKI